MIGNSSLRAFRRYDKAPLPWPKAHHLTCVYRDTMLTDTPIRFNSSKPRIPRSLDGADRTRTDTLEERKGGTTVPFLAHSYRSIS